MRQKSGTRQIHGEKVMKNIRLATRKLYSAEEKIRIVLDGLKGENSIAELCRRECIAQSLYYSWSKEIRTTTPLCLFDLIKNSNGLSGLIYLTQPQHALRRAFNGIDNYSREFTSDRIDNFDHASTAKNNRGYAVLLFSD